LLYIEATDNGPGANVVQVDELFNEPNVTFDMSSSAIDVAFETQYELTAAKVAVNVEFEY
jgi:hypothetical protein